MDTDIARRLQEVKDNLPDSTRLVAVSKFHPAELIREAYDAGQRLFGESREQELAAKVKDLPRDIEWHFIGHLQTNKVKFIAPYISMIDAVDSLKLLREINKQAAANGRVIKVLLELHIADEERADMRTYDDGVARQRRGCHQKGILPRSRFLRRDEGTLLR